MSRSFMTLLTPDCRPVPIVRRGFIVPFQDSDCRYTEAHISAIIGELELEDCDVDLRGITDIEDPEYDHLSQIYSLIAAAKQKGQAKAKAKEKAKAKPALTFATKIVKRANFKNVDYWVVNEDSFLLVRHHIKSRQKLMGLRYLRGEFPVDESRLTGWRQTERHFIDGTSDIVTDEDFRLRDDDKVIATEPSTQSWRGRTVFKLTPLTSQALDKAKIVAAKHQQAPSTAMQTDRFRLSSDVQPSSELPALTDTPSSSKDPPPAPLFRILASPAEEPRSALIDNTL